jgi:hypothetical protein
VLVAESLDQSWPYVRLPSRICRLSVAAMDALLALVRETPAAFTTQPISREFDEAGLKRDRPWLEELPSNLPRGVSFRGLMS